MNIMSKGKVLPLPTDVDLTEGESAWRIKLPSDYREFLLTSNGGEVENRSFSYGGHDYAVDRFLSLLGDYKTNELGDYDIDVVLTQLDARLTDNKDLIGVEKLPIAVLFAGDFVCLDFKESSSNPSICVWFHEESDDFAPVTIKIADSFEEFTKMLYIEE